MPPLRTITADSPDYERHRHTYGVRGAPASILVPADAREVQTAVRLAAGQPGPLAVRSGGHGRSTNDGGVVLDLDRLRDVRVLDARRGLVRVEAGARWAEVADALAPHDLAVSSGDFGDVGVGGLATGGGIGLLVRRQGLTIDRIHAAEVVLADGTLVRADAGEHPDLLWAIRGAGGAVGVVTAFELAAERVGPLTAAELTYAPDDLPGLIERWALAADGAPRDVTSFLYVQPGASGLAVRALVVAADAAAVAPFAAAGTVVAERVERGPYAGLLASSRSPHQAQAAGITSRGGLLDDVPSDTAAALADLVTSGVAVVVQLRVLGGAVADVAPGATAFAHRAQRFSLVTGALRDRRADLDAAWDDGLAGHVRGTYLNLESERGDAMVREAFPPPTLARLHEVKRRYDPAGVFDASLRLPAPEVAAVR